MPTTDPKRAFGPEDVDIIFRCGQFFCNGDTVGMSLRFHCGIDKSGLFVLTIDAGRKQQHLYFGAEEWPKFLAMVDKARTVFADTKAQGRCDELTPCPPG